MSSFQEVLDAARTLDATERLRLVETLWGETPPEEWPSPSPEWIAESERRLAEYESGRMSAKSWLEVRREAHKKAGLDG